MSKDKEPTGAEIEELKATISTQVQAIKDLRDENEKLRVAGEKMKLNVKIITALVELLKDIDRRGLSDHHTISVQEYLNEKLSAVTAWKEVVGNG